MRSESLGSLTHSGGAMESDRQIILTLQKSLEAEKVGVVTERMICRREEDGDEYARRNKWEKTQITNLAEQQCREVTATNSINEIRIFK